MNWRTIRALMRKYGYIWTRNTFRTLDVFLWPVLDLLVFGFLTVYMMKVGSAVPAQIIFLIAAIIFWNVLYRAQQVVTTMFLDDVWSRNLINIFTAPIRPTEYIAAAYLMGMVQATVILLMLGGMAALFYSFNLLSLGFQFGIQFVNLIVMGWWMGLLVIGLILRFGPKAEATAWALPFIVQPISAVFYPVSVLPPWLQPVAMSMPSTYVFESMRQIIKTGHMDAHYVWCSLALNAVYMILSAVVFKLFYEQARKKGYLAKYAT